MQDNRPDLGNGERPAAFDGRQAKPSTLRDAIDAACRISEAEATIPLLDLARLGDEEAGRASAMARTLVEGLRAQGSGGGVQGLIQEYALSSAEGVALMCLAEALLRIPDNGTRDALIRDKIAGGNWRAHLGPERSLFVNAATWGLMMTGSLTHAASQEGLANALNRLLARGGEPIVRTGVDMAMRMMGDQFVTGQTIDEALANSRKMERRGFQYSYDMLGEAAATAEDAERYLRSYRSAIEAIGKASAGRGPYGGPGISIKLSALHPRYRRSQIGRLMGELLPRLRELARLAKSFDIGLNIDAEESDRLGISLDLLEALCFDPELDGWNGIGFVVQAYGKRCPAVIGFLIDLARRSGHRLMVRLVKGAYWDSEIKQAQVDGLGDYPVFTRKVHTDVSYLASARQLLAAPDAVYPQFATHNAQTLATIYEMAGPNYAPGQYEFQCLHGMGEQLYGAVVGPEELDRPCRIYAPVGTHSTLLAYLVRRLLENGANSSFVNRIGNTDLPVEELIAHPVDIASAIVPLGSPNPLIGLPQDIFGKRRNSAGMDLASEATILREGEAMVVASTRQWNAVPVLAAGKTLTAPAVAVHNPADRRDIVGECRLATPDLVDQAFAAAAANWGGAAQRASVLVAAADALETRRDELIPLIVREAGKSVGNAVSEVREAVDFLRYYATETHGLGPLAVPLGTVVCISPWNFPLAIFTGQIAAALAAGNAVIAKPAEETPLIAAAMVDILHAAGVPLAALQFLPGEGDIGAALCGHEKVAGVAFTGSLEVAKKIQRQLAERLLPNGAPVPLIAETGGVNAMIVDSSALTEQVVADALVSAFDSAGQRCSALRVLCVQDDVADRTVEMLKGGMAELSVGNPERLAIDVGPIITAEAAARLSGYVDRVRANGHDVTSEPLGADARFGNFVAPTLIELDNIDQLEGEVFGPILHVIRYDREDLDTLVDDINRLGYGLTFGLHTRLDETIERVVPRIKAGNIYVNRNIIGAVVGVQPFGGHGLSGTGPKAGGPLYLRRFLAQRVEPANAPPSTQLPGPVGEDNTYRLTPRGEVLLLPLTQHGLERQLAVLAGSGNHSVIDLNGLNPPQNAEQWRTTPDWEAETGVTCVLVEGDATRVTKVLRAFASAPGPIVTVLSNADYNRDCLVLEVSVSTNIAAAGGNASLMALG